MDKALVVLSGGVDSTTLLYQAVHHIPSVQAISFNYGQRHHRELACANLSCKKLNVQHTMVDLTSLTKIFGDNSLTNTNVDVPEGHYEDVMMKSTVVPNRNMIMLSIATAYAISQGISNIFYGAHTGDHAIYPDCREPFITAMNSATSLCHYNPIFIITPYIHMAKWQIVALGKLLYVDYALTWSCYKGGEKACGKCGTCVERLEAFTMAGIPDPISYER